MAKGRLCDNTYLRQICWRINTHAQKKMQTRKGRDKRAREDANAQRQMQTHRSRSAQEQVQGQFGEPQREKNVDDNR